MVPFASAKNVDGGVNSSYDGRLLNPSDYSVSYLDFSGVGNSRFQSTSGTLYAWKNANLSQSVYSDIFYRIDSVAWDSSSSPDGWYDNDSGVLYMVWNAGFNVEENHTYYLYYPTSYVLDDNPFFRDQAVNVTPYGNYVMNVNYVRVGLRSSTDVSVAAKQIEYCPSNTSFNYSSFTYSVEDDVIIGNSYWTKVSFTSSFTGTLYPLLMVRIGSKNSEIVSGSTIYHASYFYSYLNRVFLNNIIFSDKVVQAEEDSTNGWLAKIKSVLDSIVSGITNLPALIWNIFSDGLKGLFIPSSDQLQSMSDQLDSTFSEKLGIVWTAFDVVLGILQGALDADAAGTVHFPGIELDLVGSTFSLAAADVSVWPAGFDVLQAVVKSAVTMVLLLAWFNGALKVKDRILGGGDSG